MYTPLDKPRLVFFQNKYDDGLPDFLLTHKQEHVNCLSLFFDVVVIQHDCDYQQICDLYRPDLALFESGVNLSTCRKPRITNVRTCQTIPKLGFFNADAWCETRSRSLSEMDQWGIETFFAISATAAQHLPAIANQLFVWPNFIDPVIFKDYNEAKLIPVLLSGATAAQYPWRRRIYKLIAEHYPSLWCPHRGYLSRSPTGQMLSGIRYARTINAAEVAPVCGTVAKEVVRKHFEIPACNTCLITERARNLEEAGFIDMVNCVFADEHDILDKLEFLFNQPDRLQRITAAGHQLVHSQHTHNNRDQILQWFNLNKSLGPDDKIVQINPFAPLSVLNKGSQLPSSSSVAEVGAHLQLLKEGDKMLWRGQVGAAASKYRRCLSYMRQLPEARFKIALCKLHQGDAAEANALIFDLIQYCISQDRAVDPDPVEWSYYIISLVCMGKLSDATNCALEFPWLRHPELDRVRRIVHLLNPKEVSSPSIFEAPMDVRRSIHQLPERSETVWREELYSILLVCGQPSTAEVIATANLKLNQFQRDRSPLVVYVPALGDHKPEPRDLQARTLLKLLSDMASSNTLDRKLAHYIGRRKLRNISTWFKRLVQKIGRHFYSVSQVPASDKHLVESIRELVRDLDVKTALIISGAIADEAAIAVLEGTVGSDSKPLICCVTDGRCPLATRNGAPYVLDHVKRYPVSTTKLEAGIAGVENAILRLKCDNLIECFDLVLFAWPEIEYRLGAGIAFREEMRAARLIVLSDLESEYHREIYAQVLTEATHVPIDHSTARGNYVIFEKGSHPREQSEIVPACASSSIYVD
jgi:hypothetical protein